MDASIGAFEAKAQLSRQLQAVAAALAALQAMPRIHGVSDAQVTGFVREGLL